MASLSWGRTTVLMLLAPGFLLIGSMLLINPACAQEIDEIAPGIAVESYFDVASSTTPSQSGYGGPGHSGGAGDSLLRLVNVGNYESHTTTPGSVCANLYVFDDDQELQECCSCPVSADGEMTFSTINDLVSNPAFSSPLSVGVIKIVGSSGFAPFNCSSGGDGQDGTAGNLAVTGGGICIVSSGRFANGLKAWLNHAETMASNNPDFQPPFGFVTSTAVEQFGPAPLDPFEICNLSQQCSSLELHASARGICKCGVGQ